MDIHIVQRFSPHIFFAEGETCFPISAELYLSQCDIKVRFGPIAQYPGDQQKLL